MSLTEFKLIAGCILSFQEGQVLECSLINSIRLGAIPKVPVIGDCCSSRFTQVENALQDVV
jgi:hypothetical protein